MTNEEILDQPNTWPAQLKSTQPRQDLRAYMHAESLTRSNLDRPTTDERSWPPTKRGHFDNRADGISDTIENRARRCVAFPWSALEGKTWPRWSPTSYPAQVEVPPW